MAKHQLCPALGGCKKILLRKWFKYNSKELKDPFELLYILHLKPGQIFVSFLDSLLASALLCSLTKSGILLKEFLEVLDLNGVPGD